MNLVSLTPGVVAQGGTQGAASNNTSGGGFTNANSFGNYSIAGGLAGQESIYLDGAPVQTSQGNATAFIVTQDAVQEFRVESSVVNPQYGMFAVGVIAFGSKAGNNRIHGSAYEYFRNTVFNANNFINNLNGIPRPKLNQNQFDVTIGGPIKRDKIFYFASYEGYRLAQGVINAGRVPTPAELVGDFTADPKVINPVPKLGPMVAPGLYASATYSQAQLCAPLGSLTVGAATGNPCNAAGSVARTAIIQPLSRAQYAANPGVFNGQPLQGREPFGKYPYLEQWNANVQQAFGMSTVLQLAYLGARGEHLPIAGSFDINQIPDSAPIGAERSYLSFDVPQHLVVSYILDLPFGKGKRFLGNTGTGVDRVIGGWNVSGINTLQSGFPLAIVEAPTPVSGAFGGGTPRPNVVAGCNQRSGVGLVASAQSSVTSVPLSTFNTGCFSATAGTAAGAYMGNQPRTSGILRRQGIDNVDFSVGKTTPIRDQVALVFRAEAFNVWNRVQFGDPGLQYASSSFGVPTTQANLPRSFQFSLRVNDQDLL